MKASQLLTPKAHGNQPSPFLELAFTQMSANMTNARYTDKPADWANH
jgi:hypothetical protein